MRATKWDGESDDDETGSVASKTSFEDLPFKERISHEIKATDFALDCLKDLTERVKLKQEWLSNIHD